MMRCIVQNGHDGPKRPRRTPRKLRVPESSSPEARKSTPHKTSNRNGTVSFPEQQHKHRVAHSHTRLNGVLEEEGITNGTKGRSKVTQNTNSPRRLPDDRFQSIRKQLDGDKKMNGVNGTSERSDPDSQSVAGESVVSKPTNRRQPRKLSVAHAVNGANGINEINGTHDGR